MSENPLPKRGRGRPTNLPPGKRRNVRCVLVNGELALLRDALETTGQSQVEFTRHAVLARIDSVLNGKARKRPKSD